MTIIELSSDPYQSHLLDIEGVNVELIFRFLPLVSLWKTTILIDDVILIDGISLSLGSVMLEQNNKPFGFMVGDSSNLGIDPFMLDDFTSGRITLYLLDRIDMAEVRGYDVK